MLGTFTLDTTPILLYKRDQMHAEYPTLTFPCANCGRPVPLEKSRAGLDHLFCRRTCHTDFLTWARGAGLAHGRIEWLFRWFRVQIVIPWTVDSGEWHASGYQRRTIDRNRRFQHLLDDGLPADAPSAWADFLYAPMLNPCLPREEPPQGFLFKHPFFVHLNEDRRGAVTCESVKTVPLTRGLPTGAGTCQREVRPGSAKSTSTGS